MEIRRITQTSDPLYEQAMALYTISFPFHEQRQALSHSQILQKDAFHFDVTSFATMENLWVKFCIGISQTHSTLNISAFRQPCGTGITVKGF